MRDIYLTERVSEARTPLREAIVGCQSDEVPKIRSLTTPSSGGPTRSSITVATVSRTVLPKA